MPKWEHLELEKVLLIILEEQIPRIGSYLFMKKRSEEDKLSETSQKRNLKETRYTTGMQGKIINKVNNGGKWVCEKIWWYTFTWVDISIKAIKDAIS